MSADAHAPELKVRFSKRDEKNGGEQEEVDIYDTLEQGPPDPRPHEVRPLTENRPAAVKRRAFGATAAILGVLYLVILAGIYMRNIFVTLEKQNVQTERDQLLMSLNQSETRNINVTEERDQLQTRYDDLSKDRTQRNIAEKWCPEGWRRFGCSCYFKSNERKMWRSSRDDCQQKGADLVVINNKEEQTFVRELNMDGHSWIGLRVVKEWNETRWQWDWEWVDRSPQTDTFWATRLPRYDRNNEAATCCNQQGQWIEAYSYVLKNWICEK